MLKEILKGYSSGELAELVGKQVVNEYESLTEGNISKSDLANAVFTMYGYELVSQEDLRHKLIDRMEPTNVDHIISSFINRCEDEIVLDERVDKYAFLSNLSDKWPDVFVSILGFEDALTTDKESNNSVDGIKALLADYQMYPYQRQMVDKFNTLTSKSNVDKILLHLPTGAGKTRTAMNIAAEHLRENEKGLVLWLADTSELCAQASSEFESAWKSLGNREIKLYSYYSDSTISLGGIDNGFLVAGLQKLNATRGSSSYEILYSQLRKHITLIIFDEAHKAIAPTYSKTVMDMTNTENNTLLLGLSATPGRKLDCDNGEDEELSKFFGSNKITMKVSGFYSPIEYLVGGGFLAKANFENIDYSGSKILLANEASNLKKSDEIRKILSEDESRNEKLLGVISDEYKKGSSIIVFACSVEHSRALAAMLSFSGIKAYSLDSKNDDTETRRYKISDYSKGNVRVIINYNILTAGFDVPRTNVSIIARPTDSLVQYSQMAGRAMRGVKSKGNEECRIYTVRDDIPAFTNVTAAFTHWDDLWKEI